VKTTSEMITLVGPTCDETPRATSCHTMSMPSGLGFGATIQGCRPISVKIQPADEARKIVGSAHSAARRSQRLPLT